MPITFLDEEEDIAPLAPPTKRKITFLDEEETEIAPTTPQAAQPAVTQPSPYKYDPARFRPKGLVAPKAEQEVGTLEGIANAARNAFDSSRQALDIVGDVTPEEAQNIAKIEFNKQSRKLAPGYDEYQKAEGFDAVLAFAKNPVEVTSNIIAEGLAGSLPALGAGLAAGGVGAAIGAPTVVGAPIGFTAGQVAGTFAGSLATEYGSKILEEMQSEGVDLTKPESIQGFFENEEAVTKARDKAIKRGIPIAAFDAISAGIGGKLGRVIGKQFLTKTGEAASELGVQAALGGGGEIAGSIAAGEPIQPKAVFGEVIGEVGPGAAEVITGRMADRTARVKAEEEKKIKAAAQLSDNLEQNNAPLTAAAVKSTTATTIEQDKLAAQLEEQLDADEIASQVVGQVTPPITTEVTPAVPTAQPPTPDATQEIIQPEGVREEPQDRVEGETPNETIARNRIFDTTRGKEEGQVVPTTQPIISEIPTTSELVGAETTQPTIREVPEISPIVGAEPAAIVEQEPVAPEAPAPTPQLETGTIQTQPFQVTIPDATGQRIARMETIEIPMEWDAEINDWLMTEEGSRMVDETKQKGIAEQKKTTPKTYAQLENEALDIQNQISTEAGVLALIGVSDDNLTISGLESREKGKGTKALEIITSAADKNQTTITLKAEPKSGDVQRLKKLYSRFGFVDDPNFAEGSNRMIRFPAAIVEQEPVAPAEPKGTRVAAAAYIAPDGTQYTGPSHLAAMEQAKNEGKITQAEIDAKQAPESRETPQFGYKTDAEPFVTRDQAEGIARQSGQLLVEKPATGQLHSNEVALDEFPKEVAAVTPAPAPAPSITPAPAPTVAPAESAIDVARKTDFTTAATREEAGEIGRNIASQDPSLPPPPPPQFEVLESISNSQSRKAYNPDVLTEEAINEARENGFITGKKVGKFRFTESGRNQLREWSDQARDRSLALDALRDEIADIAVSQWDAANAPESAAAIAARTAPTPVTTPTVTEAVTPEPTIKQRALERKESERIDKENATIKFTTQKGSQYSVGESGTIYRDKFDGKKFKANAIGFVSKDNAAKIAGLSKQYEGKAIRVIHEPNKVRFVTNHQLPTEKTVFEALASDIPQEGMYPIEGSNFVPHLGDVITSVSTPAAPTPTAPAPEAAPTGIAVGSRVKSGRDPKVYVVEEVLPQTEAEQREGDYSVMLRDEKSGKIEKYPFSIMGLKALGAKKPALPKKLARSGATSFDFTPRQALAPEQQIDRDTIIANVKAVYEGIPNDRIEIVNDPAAEGEYGYIAAYNPNTNKIEINQAYYTLEDDLDLKISHELGHYLYQDPRWKKAFARLYKNLKPSSRRKLDAFMEQVYSDYESGYLDEEAEINALEVFLKDAPDNRNLFQKFIDEILDFVTDALSVFSPYFKTLARDPRRIARNIALVASERFKSGEVIEGVDTTIEPEDLRLARAAEPTEEAPAEEARREEFAGMQVGRIITTPPGIKQKTTDIIRAKFFDSTKVSPESTSQAWAYISQFMDKADNNNNKFAGYVNNVTESELPEADKRGIDESIGAVMLQVELANYAGRLATQGDTKMLSYIIRNGNRMPTGEYAQGIRKAGKDLNAVKERLKDQAAGFAAFNAELKSNVERLASTLFGTKNPNEDQIAIAKQALTDSDNIELGDANQVAADIKEVEGRTKTNLIDKVDAKISQAIDKSGKIKDLEKKATRVRSIESQAESIIESLQRSLGELPPLPQKRESDIRTIVKQDLRQNPDMGRREPWNNMLVARLMQVGVSEEQAQMIADLTWRQHEQKAINRELKELRKAAEEGSLAVIIDRIKNTPLEKQQSPEWKKDVIMEYLRKAGLSTKAAETAANLYDSVISERLAAAKQKAFEATLAKAAPWKDYASRNSKLAKDALKKVQDAIRTGVLDPNQTAESIIAAQNGWTGFTKDQYQRIVELDTILNDPKQDDVTKMEAVSKLNKIITAAKLPAKFKEAIADYYVGQALLGIPTFSVNIASPAGFSIRNILTDIAKYAFTDPKRIPIAFESLLDSMRSWYGNVSYSFRTEVYPNDVVEYLQGGDALKEIFNRGKKQWAEGKYAEGFTNMAVGMAHITKKVLSALDQGAISMIENQNLTRYAMEALSAQKKIPKDQIRAFGQSILAIRNQSIAQSISEGMPRDRAIVLADLAAKSELIYSLSRYEISPDEVLDSAINDALQSVGRNRKITIKGIEESDKAISDTGTLTYFPIRFLEMIAEKSMQSGPAMQVFSKMVYGFALIPARVFSNVAWFSPVGAYRFAVDAFAKSQGWKSPYAMSLGTGLQYRQRLTETIAGSIAMLGLVALRSDSTEDDEDKKFKIVITGNGPNAVTDKQYYDSWMKKWKPYSIHIVVDGKIIPINIGRGGEALFFPIMLAGALDDLAIKKKQNLTKKEPEDLVSAVEVLGSSFFALAQRGPYAAFTKPLFDASKQGRVTEELASQAGYFGKTFIPVLGTSLARNITDFINDPVDRSSIEGAIYANTPVVGPWLGTKALNALGQPIRADDWGDKLFKLGVPVVFSFPKNTPENELNELILKQGSGPTIPTRANAQKRFGDILTDKEFEAYVREYGRVMSEKMFKNRTRLANLKPADYDDELEKYARGYSIDGIKIKGASDSAVLAVKRMRQ